MLNPYDKSYYESLEKKTSNLANLLTRGFSNNERKLLNEFIEAGEFGLALETLVAQIIGNRAQVSKSNTKRILHLYEIMELDTDPILEPLQKLTKND